MNWDVQNRKKLREAKHAIEDLELNRFGEYTELNDAAQQQETKLQQAREQVQKEKFDLEQQIRDLESALNSERNTIRVQAQNLKENEKRNSAKNLDAMLHRTRLQKQLEDLKEERETLQKKLKTMNEQNQYLKKVALQQFNVVLKELFVELDSIGPDGATIKQPSVRMKNGKRRSSLIPSLRNVGPGITSNSGKAEMTNNFSNTSMAGKSDSNLVSSPSLLSIGSKSSRHSILGGIVPALTRKKSRGSERLTKQTQKKLIEQEITLRTMDILSRKKINQLKDMQRHNRKNKRNSQESVNNSKKSKNSKNKGEEETMLATTIDMRDIENKNNEEKDEKESKRNSEIGSTSGSFGNDGDDGDDDGNDSRANTIMEAMAFKAKRQNEKTALAYDEILARLHRHRGTRILAAPDGFMSFLKNRFAIAVALGTWYGLILYLFNFVVESIEGIRCTGEIYAVKGILFGLFVLLYIKIKHDTLIKSQKLTLISERIVDFNQKFLQSNVHKDLKMENLTDVDHEILLDKREWQSLGTGVAFCFAGALLLDSAWITCQNQVINNDFILGAKILVVVVLVLFAIYLKANNSFQENIEHVEKQTSINKSTVSTTSLLDDESQQLSEPLTQANETEQDGQSTIPPP